MTDHSLNAPFPGRAGIGGLPVGAVSAYAGAIDPDRGAALLEASGWMICDGRALTAAQYPQLFAVLGTLYGGGDGTFKIPDYRGAFLRGTDLGSGNDPDAAIRRAPAGGSGTGAGSTQDSALQDHGHSYQAVDAQSGGEPGAAPGGPTLQAAETTGRPVPAMDSDHPVRTSRYETRPANIAVNYIIRVASL